MGFVAWHLIQFTQEALGGRQNASFYTARQYSTESLSRRTMGRVSEGPLSTHRDPAAGSRQ
jgi:hopanoid C-2 methylase